MKIQRLIHTPQLTVWGIRIAGLIIQYIRTPQKRKLTII